MNTIQEQAIYNAVLMLSGDLSIEPNVLVAVMVENGLKATFSQFIRGEIAYKALLEAVSEVC